MREIIKHWKGILIALALVFVLMGWLIWQSQSNLGTLQVKSENIRAHIEELSSDIYKGRMVGTAGNQRTLDYVGGYFESLALEAAGDDGTYLQTFDMIVPMISDDAVFTIGTDSGEFVESYTMYEDYNLLPAMNGGSIDYHGEMILVGSNLLRIDPLEIKDRIVVIESGRLEPSRIQYVIDNGGKGIICCADVDSYTRPRQFEKQKRLHVYGKGVTSIGVGFISIEAYRGLLEMIPDNDSDKIKSSKGIIKNVTLQAQIKYPVVSTSNIMGMIEGKDKSGETLIITSQIDGVGEGSNGHYFPGAVNNVSGLAVMLEVARVLSEEESLPYESIMFVGFNGEEQLDSGSGYYIMNPIVPLEKTRIIHLEKLGMSTQDGLKIGVDTNIGSIMGDRATAYAGDMGVRAINTPLMAPSVQAFADKLVPSVMLYDDLGVQNNYLDDGSEIDNVTLANSANTVLEYIKRDVYRDTHIDYLTLGETYAVWIFLTGLFLIILIGTIYSLRPRFKIGKVSIEGIYYSYLIRILRKIYLMITPIIGAIMVLVILSNLDPTLTIKLIRNAYKTNFSWYLTLKNSALYFRRMSEHSIKEMTDLVKVIYTSGYRSLLLIMSSLTFATLIGIARGIYEGYKHRRRNLKALGSIILFSIPDVLIVLGGMLLYVFIAQNFPELNEKFQPKAFILPMLTLSIMPTIYISRITYITVVEELDKTYIRSAKAIGLPRWRIFAFELMPAVLYKIIDTMPSIMTMILTNMIIVERLFNYIGIVYYLLFFYDKQEPDSFVALALTLGLVYILSTWGFKKIAVKISPIRSEVK